MGFFDDLKQEAKDALPQIKDVVKKELKEQISKRVNNGAVSTATVAAPVQASMSIPPVAMIAVAGLALFLILKKR